MSGHLKIRLASARELMAGLGVFSTRWAVSDVVGGAVTGVQAVSVSGEQFEITAGQYRATVTGLGAGLRELSYAGHELILSYGADQQPPGAAGQLLIPWPNRIDQGRYCFAGEEQQLDINDHAGGNSSHGLIRWAGWQPVSAAADQIVLGHRLLGRAGYPHVLDLLVTYKLAPESGLTVTLTATNQGTRSAPFGYGAHPYLLVDASTVDECELELAATTRITVDDRGIPTGFEEVRGTSYDFSQARAIGPMRIDGAFGGLRRNGLGQATVRLRGRERSVVLWQDETLGYVQVFTGEKLGRRALAVEPMTCPANAFRTGDHLIVLPPGERTTHTFGIRAGR